MKLLDVTFNPNIFHQKTIRLPTLLSLLHKGTSLEIEKKILFLYKLNILYGFMLHIHYYILDLQGTSYITCNGLTV